MTITSTRYIESIYTSATAQGVGALPPARIWHATDPPFKGYQPPPSFAFEQVTAETAIVIDNGTLFSFDQNNNCSSVLYSQVPVSFEPVGPLISSLETHFRLSLLVIETASLIEHVPTLDMMHMRTPRLGDKFAMPLSRAAV